VASTFESITKGFVEKIQQSFSENEILSVLHSIASKYGFEFFTYSRMFPKAMTRVDILAIGNYPAEWIDKYMKNDYLFIDPVMKHCTSSALPYFWKNIFISEDEEVIAFARECVRFGFHEGFSVGINGNCGDFSLLNFGGSGLNSPAPLEHSQVVIIAHVILPYLHEKLAQICPVSAIYPIDNQHQANIPLQELTAREKECLLWTAEGKTSHEISVILAIAESTVNFHLKNAVKKLDCINKTHAVAKAVLLGLIKNMPD